MQAVRVAVVFMGADLGVWCDRCLLPSAARVHYSLAPLGQLPPFLRSVVECVDCGHRGEPSC